MPTVQLGGKAELRHRYTADPHPREGPVMPRTRTTERTQFLHDIMITALEGGVGYWSIADRIVRHTDDDLWYAEYTLFCFDGDTDPDTWEKLPGPCGNGTDEPCRGHRITPDSVAHGLTIASDTAGQPDIGWHISSRRRARDASLENDGGEIDAGDADCILQLSIFGTVIYG